MSKGVKINMDKQTYKCRCVNTVDICDHMGYGVISMTFRVVVFLEPQEKINDGEKGRMNQGSETSGDLLDKR